jgi:hypothetical protein
LRPIQSVDVIIAALTLPPVSLQAVAWLASWRKTVISLNGSSMGVLHNCVATKEKKKKTERSITPSTHTASKKNCSPAEQQHQNVACCPLISIPNICKILQRTPTNLQRVWRRWRRRL